MTRHIFLSLFWLSGSFPRKKKSLSIIISATINASSVQSHLFLYLTGVLKGKVLQLLPPVKSLSGYIAFWVMQAQGFQREEECMVLYR